jgi:hypothetical protein
LQIALWNASGLQNHKELNLFLNENKIDIILISETHFTSKSHFSIAGYNICLANHPDGKAHGGTAILIKSKIAYVAQPCYAKPQLQAAIIQLQGPHQNITIASTYCPPQHNLKVTHFDSFFQTLGSCFIVGGDFNSNGGWDWLHPKDGHLPRSYKWKLLSPVYRHPNILANWYKKNTRPVRLFQNLQFFAFICRHTAQLRLIIRPYHYHNHPQHYTHD